MDCRNIETDLSALIDGELSGERQAEVIEHVDSCPTCSRRVAELQRLASGIGILPKLEPSTQFLSSVRRKLRPAKRWEVALFRPFWLKVPLEALAAVAIVFWLTRSRPAEPVVAMKTAPSPSLEMRARILPEEQPAAAPVASAAMERGDLSGKQFAGGIGSGGSGGNLIDALRAKPPVPVIVTGESLVAVRLRVTELAQMLNGQVEAAPPSNTFVVRLPSSKVSEFRTRLTQKPTLMYAADMVLSSVEVKVIVEPTDK